MKDLRAPLSLLLQACRIPLLRYPEQPGLLLSFCLHITTNPRDRERALTRPPRLHLVLILGSSLSVSGLFLLRFVSYGPGHLLGLTWPAFCICLRLRLSRLPMLCSRCLCLTYFGIFRIFGPRLSSRARSRLGVRRAAFVTVAALNYLHAGCNFPSHEQLRRRPNVSQAKALNYLERLVRACGAVGRKAGIAGSDEKALGLGLVGPSRRSKRIALAAITLELARLQSTSDHLHLCLVGGWVSGMLYRRPFMSILNGAFTMVDASTVSQTSPKILGLPRCVADELVLAASLCHILVADISADWALTLFATPTRRVPL